MSRAILYTRVSTDEQADSGLGLAAQREQLQVACAARSFEVVATLEDAGVSGSTLDRPSLMVALEMLAAGQAEVIAVAKLDRLTRSMADLARLLEWLDDVDAHLLALDLGIDTSTPAGRLVTHVLGSISEWERGVISQRTKDALAVARAAGRRTCGPSLRDDDELVSVVREMRESGLTLRQIAAELDRREVPTLRGGASWRPSALQSLLCPPRRARRRRVALPVPR